MLTTASKVNEQLTLSKVTKLENDLALVEAKIQSVLLGQNQRSFVLNINSGSDELIEAITNAGYTVLTEELHDYECIRG